MPLGIALAAAVVAVALGGGVGFLLGLGNQPGDLASVPSSVGQGSEPGAEVPADAVSVTGLTVDAGGVDERVELAIGESFMFKAVVELADASTRDDAPVQWSSSDPRVLAVDPDGTATGLAAGQAIVHAVLAPFQVQFRVNVGGAASGQGDPNGGAAAPDQPDAGNATGGEAR